MKSLALTRSSGWGVLLIVGVAVVYLPALSLGFVWDDHALIFDYGEVLADPALLVRGLLADLWAVGDQPIVDSGYYRPLMLLSLAIDRALFGLAPWGYHLHSLAWHLLCVGLLHQLLRRLAEPPAALAGAVLLGLHPLNSEAVIWIAARNDLIAAALSLAALLVLWPTRAAAGRLVAGGLLTAGAVLGKESALLLPVMLVLLDLARGERPGWRRAAAALAGVLAALSLRAVSGVGAGELPTAATLGFFLLKLPQIVGLQLSLLVWPWPLSGGRALEWLHVPPPVLALGAGVLAAGAAISVWLPAAQRRIALAGVGVALLGFLPALLPLSTKGLIGERYLYLPMAGIAIWLAAALSGRGRAALLLAGATAAGGALLISARMPDWASDLDLWAAAMADTPNPYVFSGLGHTLNADDGDRVQASRLLIAALEAEPPVPDACGVVITATLRSGQPAEAARVAPWSLSRGCPADGDYVGRASVAQAFAGEWEAARETLALPARDPERRDDVVRAALLRLDGDEAGYTQIRARWPEPQRLDEQVQRLLLTAAVEE